MKNSLTLFTVPFLMGIPKQRASKINTIHITINITYGNDGKRGKNKKPFF